MFTRVVEEGRQLFREMGEEDGIPALGPEDLGVRLGIDIRPDDTGMIWPETGGMSVVPDDPRHLHRAHRPRSLGGTGTKPVWKISEESVVDPLTYRPDPKRPGRHGFVEPLESIDVTTYTSCIDKTAGDWERVDV